MFLSRVLHRFAARSVPPRPIRVSYGCAADQFGELYLPADEAPARGVAVVVHGGFWQQAYGLVLGRPLAADLASTGVAAWNIEYRRVGGAGGWPTTFLDVAAALDALADLGQRSTQETVGSQAAVARLDLERVVAVGHSAGGHLAAWLAARPGMPAGAPGAAPRVRLRGVVSQAGVLDLVDAAEGRVGGSAVDDLLGGPPSAVPDRYRLASPIARLPTGVPVVCVHGTHDRDVPIRQSERYLTAARKVGDPVELIRLSGVEHYAVIDARADAWAVCREAVLRLLS